MDVRTGRLRNWIAILERWEARLLEWFHTYQNQVLLAALIGIALLLRWQLYPFVSPEYQQLSGFLEAANQSEAPGGNELAALLGIFPPVYLFLINILSLLLSQEAALLLMVKLIPWVFEAICAVYLYKLVRLRYPAGHAPLYTVLGLLFAPSVVMSGSFQGRPDILAVTALAACLYYLVTGRTGRAWLAYSLAVALQPQALFLIPLLVALMARRRLPWWGIMLVPAVFLASLVPLWWWMGGQVRLLALAAYPLGWMSGLLYPTLSIDAWAPAEIPIVFYWFGLIFGAGALVVLALAAVESARVLRVERQVEWVLLLAVISLLAGLYLFPGTQAGGFLPVDVLSIPLAFFVPGLFYLPFVMAFLSTHARLAELFNIEIIPLLYLSFVPLGLILILVRYWATHTWEARDDRVEDLSDSPIDVRKDIE